MGTPPQPSSTWRGLIKKESGSFLTTYQQDEGERFRAGQGMSRLAGRRILASGPCHSLPGEPAGASALGALQAGLDEARAHPLCPDPPDPQGLPGSPQAPQNPPSPPGPRRPSPAALRQAAPPRKRFPPRPAPSNRPRPPGC